MTPYPRGDVSELDGREGTGDRSFDGKRGIVHRNKTGDQTWPLLSAGGGHAIRYVLRGSLPGRPDPFDQGGTFDNEAG